MREIRRQRQKTHSVKKMKPENFLVFAVAFLYSLYSQGGSSVATFCNSNDFVYYLGDYFSLLSRLWKCILGPFSINIQKRAKKKDFLRKKRK